MDTLQFFSRLSIDQNLNMQTTNTFKTIGKPFDVDMDEKKV
jgi:hypothetical protein